MNKIVDADGKTVKQYDSKSTDISGEQGLGTCWVCNFDASQCSTVLGLPEYIEPAVLIPVGYAEDEPVEKKRKMLNEILL